MVHYYINPKTRDLYVFDPDEKELLVLERIGNVRVLISNDIQQGDFPPSSQPNSSINF